MPTNIPYDKTRYKQIEKLIERERADSGNNLPTAKILLKGKSEKKEIYRIPTSELLFNKANGRIVSEVLSWESENGRSLNEFVQEDQLILRNLLLNIRKDENEKIKDDLKKNGQLNPGIITCDGITINGNRRKALLEELFEEKHEEKFKYLETHVLPSSITKSELWLIEAGIQLSAPQQLDYSPINHLLKLRDGLNAGLNVDDMATRIYGMTSVKLENDLARIKLIDEYLTDYLKRTGCYYVVFGLNEHFIDLQIILDWAKRPRGNIKKDWDHDDSDVAELKLVAFHYIRDKWPHLRIRQLREVFCIKSSWEEIKKILDEVDENEEEREGDAQDIDQEDSDYKDLDDLDDQEELDDAVQEELKEKIWRRRNNKILKNRFQDARENRQINQDQLEPFKLANRGLKNLNAISTDSEGFFEPAVDSIFGEIIQTVNSLRSIHKKANKSKRKNPKPRKKISPRPTKRKRKEKSKRK